MNRLLKAAAALCLLAVPAFASNTTYTATVTDTDGQAWLNGTWNAVLTLPSGPFGNVKPTVGGSAVPVSARGVLSAAGLMTVNVTNPQSLDQTGGVWLITVCPNSSVSQVADTGCVTVPIKDTGGDITARFTGLKAPRFPAGENAFGYSDIEVIPPAVPGVQYFNTGNVSATQGLRVWDGKQWNGVGAGDGAGIPPAGTDTEYQSRTSSTAFGRTGVYTDDPANPTLSNTKVPQGLYTFNSAKTNPQFGSSDTYHRFQLCSQDAVVANSNGTAACNQEFSTFVAPGNNSGGTNSNGNFGWSVSKLHERYMLVQTPGISQVESSVLYCFKTGDCANHYAYQYNFGGWEDNSGEGDSTLSVQTLNNTNMYQAVAQTTQTGPSTFTPASWGDYPLVGGYIINKDRPLASGSIIGETEHGLGGQASAGVLQASAAVFTPSTFQGTNPSAINIGNPNAANGVTLTVTLTGTGTINVGQPIIIGCQDYPVFVTPTAVTGGSGTWQITGAFYRGCAAGGEAWQGGTHGLLTLNWVDKVIHEVANTANWQSGWLIGGASDSTHISVYNYVAGFSRGHLNNWGQDWGQSFPVTLNRVSNVTTICGLNGAYASQPLAISGASDASFNGTFTAGAVNNSTFCFSWPNTGANASNVTATYSLGGTVGGTNGRGAFTVYPGAMIKQAIPATTVSNGTTSQAFSGAMSLFANDMPITAGDHIYALQGMANKSSALQMLGHYSTPPTNGQQDVELISFEGSGVQGLDFHGRRTQNNTDSHFYANGGGTGHAPGPTADYIHGPFARIRYVPAPLPGGMVEEVDVSDATFFGVHGDYFDRLHRSHQGSFGYYTKFDPWNVIYTTVVSNADTSETSVQTTTGEGFSFVGKMQMNTRGVSDQTGALTGLSSDSQGHLATNAGYVPGSAAANVLYGNNTGGTAAPAMFTIPGVNTNLFYNSGGSIAADTNTALDGSGNLSAKTVTVTDTSGVGFGFVGTEGSAPGGVSAKDGFWADSTAHRLRMNNNNTGARTVVGLATPGTNGHIVRFDTNGIDLVDGGAAGITASGSTCTITEITNGVITGASCTP